MGQTAARPLFMGMSLSADEACSEQVKDEHVLLQTASSEAARGDMTTSICLHETQGKSAFWSRHQALPRCSQNCPCALGSPGFAAGGAEGCCLQTTSHSAPTCSLSHRLTHFRHQVIASQFSIHAQTARLLCYLFRAIHQELKEKKTFGF